MDLSSGNTVWLFFLVPLVGAAAGFLNVLAGGGSFLTLPLLIFLGLPPNLANGTNRLAIVMQNSVSIGGFLQQGIRPGRFALRATLCALPGGVMGAWLATQVSNTTFRLSLAILMLIMSLATFLQRRGDSPGLITPREFRGNWWIAGPAFFAVGIYGGYIQAGVGFLILTLLLWQQIDLVHGNAVKLLIIVLFSAAALFVFSRQGLVDWRLGFLLGLGNMAGGWLATRVAVRRGHVFIQRGGTGAGVGVAS